jgi:hypothetical protein
VVLVQAPLNILFQNDTSAENSENFKYLKSLSLGFVFGVFLFHMGGRHFILHDIRKYKISSFKRGSITRFLTLEFFSLNGTPGLGPMGYSGFEYRFEFAVKSKSI